MFLSLRHCYLTTSLILVVRRCCLGKEKLCWGDVSFVFRRWCHCGRVFHAFARFWHRQIDVRQTCKCVLLLLLLLRRLLLLLCRGYFLISLILLLGKISSSDRFLSWLSLYKFSLLWESLGMRSLFLQVLICVLLCLLSSLTDGYRWRCCHLSWLIAQVVITGCPIATVVRCLTRPIHKCSSSIQFLLLIRRWNFVISSCSIVKGFVGV